MQSRKEWSEKEFDLKLYESMDAEGKMAWRAVFGLPETIENPSARYKLTYKSSHFLFR